MLENISFSEVYVQDIKSKEMSAADLQEITESQWISLGLSDISES